MNKPSEKALSIAEDLLDYAHPGMPRGAAVHEIAGIMDEMNEELLDAVSTLLSAADRSGPGRHALLLNQLRQVMLTYKSYSTDKDSGHQFYTSSTTTGTQDQTKAQLPH